MKVLNVSHGADTGGVGNLIKRAFDKHSDWLYRQVSRRLNYINYPRDVERAKPHTFDVLHVNNRFGKLDEMPSVVHYHGTGFRENPERFLTVQRERRAVGVVSTLDLELLAPTEVSWCPAPYDLDWLSTFRQPQDGPLRIGHAPTARAIKSTELFLESVSRMSDVELVLVEKTDWDTCLKRKGTVDVFYDQVILGYGNNAIEAWGMGIPVIAGAQPDTLAEMRNRFGVLPFYLASEDTLADALETMRDPAVREEYATRGLADARRFHGEEPVVRLLEDFYLRAVDKFTA